MGDGQNDRFAIALWKGEHTRVVGVNMALVMGLPCCPASEFIIWGRCPWVVVGGNPLVSCHQSPFFFSGAVGKVACKADTGEGPSHMVGVAHLWGPY